MGKWKYMINLGYHSCIHLPLPDVISTDGYVILITPERRRMVIMSGSSR